jgi:peptidoglycan/LPS O-acetylase OafA/YrhL
MPAPVMVQHEPSVHTTPALSTPSDGGRIDTVDILRGLTALAVCVFHFVQYNTFIPPTSLAWRLSDVGRYGVDVFFVISGFIVPHALHRSGYTIVDYPRFLLKRLLRLEPPYLASIVLVLLLTAMHWIHLGFDSRWFNVTWQQVLLHAGYVNVFFGYPWLNGVYWSLAIEFQYYLAIGLIFPLLVDRRRWPAVAVLVLLVAVALMAPGLPADRPTAMFIHYWLCLFLMGVVAFWHRQRFLSTRQLVVVLALLAAAHAQKQGIHNLSMLYGVVAALVICFANLRSAIGKFLGEISYSLYLVHLPLMANWLFFTRGISKNPHHHVLMTVPGVLLVVLAAWVFCRYVEKPSREWAARIRYPAMSR